MIAFTVLKEIIPEYKTLTYRSQLGLAHMMMKYVLRHMAYRDFTKTLNGLSIKPTVELRRALKHACLNDHRIILKFKQNCIGLIKTKQAINRHYQALLRLILVENDTTFIEAIEALPLYSTKQLQENFQRFYPAIVRHAKKFTKYKMRFLFQSNRLEVHDLAGDLVEKGLKTFYYLYPFYSDLHMVRAIIRSMSNHGQNMIVVGTAEKRNRLMKTADGGFQNVEKAYTHVDSAMGYEYETGTEDYTQVPKMEFQALLNRLMARYRATDPKKHTAFKLLLGMDDREFLSFVSTRHKEPVRSCSDARETLAPKKYNELVRRYVGISKPTYTQFLEELQSPAIMGI